MMRHVHAKKANNPSNKKQEAAVDDDDEEEDEHHHNLNVQQKWNIVAQIWREFNPTTNQYPEAVIKTVALRVGYRKPLCAAYKSNMCNRLKRYQQTKLLIYLPRHMAIAHHD